MEELEDYAAGGFLVNFHVEVAVFDGGRGGVVGVGCCGSSGGDRGLFGGGFG